MFVKVKQALVESKVDSALKALQYDIWMHNYSLVSILSNKLLNMKGEKIARMKSIGPACLTLFIIT